MHFGRVDAGRRETGLRCRAEAGADGGHRLKGQNNRRRHTEAVSAGRADWMNPVVSEGFPPWRIAASHPAGGGDAPFHFLGEAVTAL